MKTKFIIFYISFLIFILFLTFLYFNRSRDNYEYIRHKDTKYELVIGAAFKNEGHILDEWVRHYKFHGIDHIYLINDGSTDDFETILEPYIQEGYVTLFNNTLKIDGYPRQQFLYEKYFRPIISISKWWAIIDLDEFMYSPNKIDLKEAMIPYENYSQIYIKWKMFGSNGHDEQPKNVVSSFTKRKIDNSNENGKSIVRSDLLKSFSVHYHETDVGGPVLVTDIFINHYAIQSWSFFQRVKMTRGDVNNYAQTVGVVRDRSYFDKYDYNEVEDLELARQNESLSYIFE